MRCYSGKENRELEKLKKTAKSKEEKQMSIDKEINQVLKKPEIYQKFISH